MKANTLTTAAVIAAVSVSATAIYVGVSADPEPQIIREVIYLPAPTTTSTSTTTTTTTTIPIPVEQAKVIPAKSSLAAKIDEWSPGTSSQVSATALKAGGQMACNMWEAGPTSRMSVMREVAEVMNLTSDQMNIAALVAQAVLYTGCRAYANFPEGPLPFDCMGNGKICD